MCKALGLILSIAKRKRKNWENSIAQNNQVKGFSCRGEVRKFKKCSLMGEGVGHYFMYLK
jgi:hypothetical protein